MNTATTESTAPESPEILPTPKPVRLKMSEFLKSKLKVHRGRPRKPFTTAKVTGLFVDKAGIEYSQLSNGMIVRTTPKGKRK